MIRSKAISGQRRVADNYDANAKTIAWCCSYNHADDITDVQFVVKDFLELKPFRFHPGRCHKTFNNIKMTIVCDIDIAKLVKWIKNKIIAYATELGQQQTALLCCAPWLLSDVECKLFHSKVMNNLFTVQHDYHDV